MRRTSALSVLSLLVALLVPDAIGAQTLSGRIVERVTQTPLAGVLVQLIDSTGNATTQTLTNPQGAYRFAAPAPGLYSVRTLRIGYTPVTSAPMRVGSEDVEVPALVAGMAISLDTIRVVGRNSCRNMGDAKATFAIWEQARTALTTVALTGRSSVIGATTVTFQQKLEPGSRRVVESFARLRSGFTTQAWNSLPIDSLRKVGYAVTDDQGWTHYYAPDLDVLLSDEFLEDHCFRIAEERGAGLVGIDFEPKRDRRGVVGIRGTIWLQRTTSELRRMEFRYTNVSPAEGRANTGGEMHFARMKNGTWLISRWQIRMPILTTQYVAASGFGGRSRIPEVVVTHMRVEGGTVALVTQGADTLWSGQPLTIAGTVQDSVTGSTIPGTSLSLRGTGRVATSDSSGAFGFADVLPGEYILDVRTPQLDALGALHSMPVLVTDSAVQLTIRAPDALAFARLRCEAPGGIVAGRVFVRGDSMPRPGARVVAEWVEPSSARRWLDVRTDARGNFRLCGAPVNTQVVLRAQTDSGASDVASVRLPENRQFATADLTIDRPLPSVAVLTGVVLSDINGAPILDVEVSLPALSRMTFTNADGAFRIAEVPVGTHHVLLRRIGWQPRAVDVEFAAGATVERKFLLSKVVALDTVAVTASELPRDFEEHRKQGLGRFLTGADLERLRGQPVHVALRNIPGLQLVTGSVGAAWVRGGRGASLSDTMCRDLEGATTLDGEKGCNCFAQVFLDGMRLYDGKSKGPVPNINTIPAESIEAIEFYVGGAQTPLKYSTLNSGCGVLVIHTRRYRAKDPN